MDNSYTIDKEMLTEYGVSEEDADTIMDGPLFDDLMFKLDETLYLWLKNKGIKADPF